jgi:hypothetical protein
MPIQPPTDTLAADAVLDALLDEFVDGLERGDNPSVEEFVQRHPDHAAQLRSLLPAARLMASLGARTGSRASRAIADHPVPPEFRTLGDFHLIRDWPRRHGHRVRGRTAVA